MGKNDDPVNLVWGNATTKELKIQQFIGNQQSEAIKLREEAERARESSEKAHQETIYQAQRQTAILAENASFQQRDIDLKRLAPELLFSLDQSRPVLRDACNGLVSEHADLLEPLTCIKAYKSIVDYSKSLFQLDSSYLSDFSQKKLLLEMREELRTLINRVNGPEARPFRLKVMEAMLTDKYSILNNFTDSELNAYHNSIIKLTTLSEQNNKLKSKVSGRMIYAMGGGAVVGCILGLIITFLIYAICSYLGILYETGNGGIEIWGAIPMLLISGLILGLVYGPKVFLPVKLIKKTEKQCQELAERLNKIYPLKDAQQLKSLRESVIWEDGQWSITEKAYAKEQEDIDAQLEIILPN